MRESRRHLKFFVFWGEAMPEEPFYAEGLCFSCTRCSACCRFDPGYVFLSKKDADVLAGMLKIGYTEFVETYCRWVSAAGGSAQLSLKEKSNYDCIFWKEGCRVYEGRPVQCRTFPFWPSILASPDAWKSAARSCPGMGKGELHNREHIESCLKARRQEPCINRAPAGPNKP
jgi:Fe-S-cluster containining protein